MTEEMMHLRSLLEKSPDADLPKRCARRETRSAVDCPGRDEAGCGQAQDQFDFVASKAASQADALSSRTFGEFMHETRREAFDSDFVDLAELLTA